MPEPTQIIEDEKGVRIPSWLLGIICTLIATAVVAGTALIVDTRTDVARLDERLGQMEKDREKDAAALVNVPTQLATLSAQLTSLQGEVARLSAKLDDRASHVR